MPDLAVIPKPVHRCYYPGELFLYLTTVSSARELMPAVPFQVTIGIQWQSFLRDAVRELAKIHPGISEVPVRDDGEHELWVKFEGRNYPVAELADPGLQTIEHGACKLTAKDGEPYYLELQGDISQGGVFDANYVAMQLDDLAEFFGAELANEIGHHIAGLIADWDRGRIEERYLRFRDMTRFNDFWLRLCSVIAADTGEPFDTKATLLELLRFWTETKGSDNVPGQLSWYAENGPSDGETPEEYAAVASDFQALVTAGRHAAERDLAAI